MANLASITLPNNVTYNFRDSDAVHLTGAETITGAKTFGTEVIIDRDDDYPNIKFHFDGSYVGRIECEDTGIFNLVEGSETYSLPAPTGSSSYDILTSKNPVTIEQGGTGAINCEGAVNNLFNGYAYYKYVPAEDPVEDEDMYYVGLGGPYDTTTPAQINITPGINSVGFGCFPSSSNAVELNENWSVQAVNSSGADGILHVLGNSYLGQTYNNASEIPLVINSSSPAIGVGAVPTVARRLELANNWFLNVGGGITLKSLSEIPSETGSRMYPFTATANLVPDSGNTIPNYAKGIFACSGNDSIILAVDAYRNLYVGFRNGATWKVSVFARDLSSNLVVSDFSTSTFNISANNHSTQNINVTKSGYDAVGIVGVTWTGSAWPVLAGYKLTSATNVALYLVNPTSSAISNLKYTVSVLYRRTFV